MTSIPSADAIALDADWLEFGLRSAAELWRAPPAFQLQLSLVQENGFKGLKKV